MTFFGIIINMKRMARPRKEKGQLLSVPLRIQVTTAQRELIDEAIRLENSEFSEWARAILLEAAKRRIAKAGADKTARR